MLDLSDFARARRHMVDTQIAGRGVRDPHILDAMREVPREAFVDEGYEEFAYEDSSLPIAEGQTISQPYVVAMMIEAGEMKPGDTVLEIGAGSGYAAAVFSRIAHQVFAIERHPSLAATARNRLGDLGYDNIDLRAGDGTKGWQEKAPFDVIVVSAGGPGIPVALKGQLAIGGRLVIPVGTERSQALLKITRASESDFRTENIGAVLFVPLIGEQGWNGGTGSLHHRSEAPPSRSRPLPKMIADVAEPLPDFDDPAFGRLFDRFADRRIVLLGEASHGTAEFYRARAAITRHLIETHNFSIVAVEADWPDAATIDRYMRHRPGRANTGHPSAGSI
jgi:protein-L-isoaspartate(D-aspartate) O-methyltransferase